MESTRTEPLNSTLLYDFPPVPEPPNEPPTEPRNKIREIRKALELRHPTAFRGAAVAARLGVSESALARWERGVSLPNRRHAKALARDLGVSLEELGLEDAP